MTGALLKHPPGTRIVPVTFRMPPSLARRVEACAEAEGVSVNRWIVTRLAHGARADIEKETT